MPTPRIAQVPVMRATSGTLTVALEIERSILSPFHVTFLVLAAFLASSRSIFGPLVRTAFIAV